MAPDERHDEEDEGPDALAEKMEGEAQRLEERSHDLGQDIQETRQDWERKQADPGVPGAVGDPGHGDAGAAPADTPTAGNAESEDEGESVADSGR
jgi:hypothetical protein